MDLDHELIRIVSEDIDYLTNDWSQNIDDSSLRRSSPVLRSLLIDNQLVNVANMLNEEISVMAPLISIYEEELDDSSIEFYQSGGAKHMEMEVAFVMQTNRVMTPGEKKSIYEKQKELIGKNYSLKITKFMKQVSFMINGTKINREEVVKYVANKRGGTHYDSSRNTEIPGRKGELEKKFALLDGVHDGRIMADKNAVYYELLSIGQRIIASHDVQRIRKIIGQGR